MGIHGGTMSLQVGTDTTPLFCMDCVKGAGDVLTSPLGESLLGVISNIHYASLQSTSLHY